MKCAAENTRYGWDQLGTVEQGKVPNNYPSASTETNHRLIKPASTMTTGYWGHFDLFTKAASSASLGYSHDSTHGQCRHCAKDYGKHTNAHQSAVGCVRCESNKSALYHFSKVADTPSNAPAVPCAYHQCGENFHSSSGDHSRCVACESGKSLGAMTAAASAVQNPAPGTTCGAMICTADQHVGMSDGANFASCLDCVNGEGNPQGDNANTRTRGGTSDKCVLNDNRISFHSWNFAAIVDQANTAELPDSSISSTTKSLTIAHVYMTSDWSADLWRQSIGWITQCENCKANYYSAPDTYACTACPSGKSSSGGNRWDTAASASDCKDIPAAPEDGGSGVLIGAVCGGIAGVALLGVAAYCCKKKRS